MEKSDCEKDQLYNKAACMWDLQSPEEMIVGLKDFNGHVGEQLDGFEGVCGEYGFGKRNVEGRRLLEFCDKKELCLANTWSEKKQRKITYSMGGNETEIDFVLVGKSNRNCLKDVKAISWELQQTWTKSKKVVKNEQTARKV